jgi:hypothetical protein
MRGAECKGRACEFRSEQASAFSEKSYEPAGPSTAQSRPCTQRTAGQNRKATRTKQPRAPAARPGQSADEVRSKQMTAQPAPERRETHLGDGDGKDAPGAAAEGVAVLACELLPGDTSVPTIVSRHSQRLCRTAPNRQLPSRSWRANRQGRHRWPSGVLKRRIQMSTKRPEVSVCSSGIKQIWRRVRYTGGAEESPCKSPRPGVVLTPTAPDLRMEGGAPGG